jgi:hypothetical protein
MTRRRLPRASDLPALTAFARGYLHEDALVEYSSALDAAGAFGRDATVEERRALIADLERLIHALEYRSVQRLERFFAEELRAAWTPATLDDLRSMLARLTAIETR